MRRATCGRRALLAVSPRAVDRMSRILAGWDLTQPPSLHAMVDDLRCKRFELIIVGHFFDDSQAIEAVWTALQQAPHVPLVCVCGAPFRGPLGEGALAAFHAAAEQLGADCFVDVLKFPDNPEGNAQVRAILDRLARGTA